MSDFQIGQPSARIDPAPVPSGAKTRRALWGLLSLFIGIGLTACGGDSDLSGTSSSISGCLKPEQMRSRDLQRNRSVIAGAPLCIRRQEIHEGQFHWVFHLIEHRKATKGPFWVLPHDNENAAFDTALRAVIKYGGGMLAVDSNGARRHRGQDPNRNFSKTASESRLCSAQRRPSPRYTLEILAHYQGRRGPYLSMHNNHDGWSGNGGRGSISLYRETSVQRGFPSNSATGQLRDADNLIFIAGLGPPSSVGSVGRRIKALNAAGLNVVYKQVTDRSFDCSLSDYVARHRLGDYYNIEAQHGQGKAQTEMLHRLMSMLGIKPLQRAASSPFLQ